jgi:hypothetical protein
VFLVTRNHHGFVCCHLDQVHLSAACDTLHVGNLVLDDALILTESPCLSPLLSRSTSLFLEFGTGDCAVGLFIPPATSKIACPEQGHLSSLILQPRLGGVPSFGWMNPRRPFCHLVSAQQKRF